METGRDGSRVANAVVMELLNGLRLGRACGGDGHGGARTDGGRRNPASRGHGRARTDGGSRIPPPRGHREPRTDRGRADRDAVLVTDVPERMEEAEFRPLVVTGGPERMRDIP